MTNQNQNPVDHATDVNHRDAKGQTPLHYAALRKDLALAQAILAAGGDLSLKDQYRNAPLWTAIFNARGQYDIVKLYMQHGADPTAKNKAGRSPLDFANQLKEQPLIALLSPR